jgi:hypothetical protein
MNTTEADTAPVTSKRRCRRYVMWTLLMLLLVCLLAFGRWARKNVEEIRAVERAIAADKDDKPSYEAFAATHSFPYSASSERRERIARTYSRLRVGLSKAEVATILGDPDYSEQMRSKGPRDEYLGTSWTYLLEKPNPRIANEKLDKMVGVFFDPSGKVDWVVSNIEGLVEIGKPGR